MSSDQTTLSGAVSGVGEEPGDGSATRRDGADAPTRGRDDGVSDGVRSVGTPADAGQCLSCGHAVSAEVSRVLGDNHGRVLACAGCEPMRDGTTRTDAHAAAAALTDAYQTSCVRGDRR